MDAAASRKPPELLFQPFGKEAPRRVFLDRDKRTVIIHEECDPALRPFMLG
jgi:hypothetical protein